jgi:PAS domain S-box-containing protein
MAEALPAHEVSEAKELIYDGRPIITETDLHGRLTYVNRKFIEMSGYSKSELLGRSHNVVRHPDMPSSCYMLLWQTIRSGQSWQGYIKNRRKNGDYYSPN